MPKTKKQLMFEALGKQITAFAQARQKRFFLLVVADADNLPRLFLEKTPGAELKDYTTIRPKCRNPKHFQGELLMSPQGSRIFFLTEDHAEPLLIRLVKTDLKLAHRLLAKATLLPPGASLDNALEDDPDEVDAPPVVAPVVAPVLAPFRARLVVDLSKTEALGTVLEALVLADPRFRLDKVGGKLETAYSGQQLVEVSPKLFNWFKDQAYACGATDVTGAAAIDSAFTPTTLKKSLEKEEKTLLGKARTRAKDFSYDQYDQTFTTQRKDSIKLQLQAKTAIKGARHLLETEGFEGLCLGETHGNENQKQFLIDNMDELVQSGVDTLYIEHFRKKDYQELIDTFLSSGPTDDMPGPLDVALTRLNGGAKLREILVKAKVAGVRVVGIDDSSTRGSDGDRSQEERAGKMNVFAEDVIRDDTARTGKYVVLAGSAHHQTHSGKEHGMPGMSQLLNQPSVTVGPDGKLTLQEEKTENRGSPLQTAQRALAATDTQARLAGRLVRELGAKVSAGIRPSDREQADMLNGLGLVRKSSKELQEAIVAMKKAASDAGRELTIEESSILADAANLDKESAKVAAFLKPLMKKIGEIPTEAPTVDDAPYVADHVTTVTAALREILADLGRVEAALGSSSHVEQEVYLRVQAAAGALAEHHKATADRLRPLVRKKGGVLKKSSLNEQESKSLAALERLARAIKAVETRERKLASSYERVAPVE